MRMILLVLYLLSFISTNAQEEYFRGRVEVITYDLLNQPSRARMARTLAKMNELNISELDTIFWEHYVCQDTMITYFKSLTGQHQYKHIEFGDHQYIYDPLFYVFLKAPKSKGLFNLAEASDWKRHRKQKQRGIVAYDYSLVKPNDQKMLFFAALDESPQYGEQASFGGYFSNVFHPFGIFKDLVFHDGYTDVMYAFKYFEDESLSCLEHFDDFFIKDVSKGAAEILGYDTNTDLIAEEERLKFKVTSLVDTNQVPSSWSSFLGKYVYVDLWASWCGPCRIEMPFMAQVRKKYSSEQLALLSISLDNKEDNDKWLKAIKDLRMDWTNWAAYGGFESDFSKKYDITAIPRYLLIDPQGRIINANAPRPSDERLGVLLDGLGIGKN